MFIPEKINPFSRRAREEIAGWLKEFGLDYGSDAETTFVLRDNGRIIATGSRTGNVFQYFAVSPHRQGENLSGILLTALMEDALLHGITHWFIFTQPEKTALFQSSGFREIIRNPYAALLEAGSGDISRFVTSLRETLGEACGTRGAIVMNLNPMTLGHLFLILEACRKVDELIIFLVEEDLSVFPFAARLKILQETVAEYPKVRVIPGGPYLISRATFPTYFLKQTDSDLTAYTTTDAGIFGKYYAPALGITSRFVGDEPFDPVTAAYNEALKKELVSRGVELLVIPRLSKGGKAISASQVRLHLARGEMAEALSLVPPATARYLTSPEGDKVIQTIRSKEEDGK